jgi:hypothetical protein
MAHKSAGPNRMQSRKKQLPRGRGEKYAAPESGADGPAAALPPGTRGRGRKGQAHDLVRRARPGSLKNPTRGRRPV